MEALSSIFSSVYSTLILVQGVYCCLRIFLHLKYKMKELNVIAQLALLTSDVFFFAIYAFVMYNWSIVQNFDTWLVVAFNFIALTCLLQHLVILIQNAPSLYKQAFKK